MNCELNISLRCNRRCLNCNRLVDRFPNRTEDISPGRIADVVCEAAARGIHFKKVKVVGGDPCCHPAFPAIYDILVLAAKQGIIGQVKIETQEPRPAVPPSPFVHWMGKSPRKKFHLPVLWSPRDMGYETAGPCAMTRRCGASLDINGWLPCSAAIMIARCFNLEHLYRQEIPVEPWGLDELCPHCVFSMPDEWCRKHSYPILATPKEAREPTPSWAAALEWYGKKICQTTQERANLLRTNAAEISCH